MTPLRLVLAVAMTGLVTLIVVLTIEPGWYVRLQHPLKYPTFIRAHAANYELPPELVAAVIYQESRFDERAKSSAGAVGLMQLTPDTAKGIARRTGGGDFRPADLLDPEINIRYGCWYLQHLRDKYEGRGNTVVLALAAYNAGQGRVDKWLAREKDGSLTADEIPFEETREYVRSVRHLRRSYRKAYPELQDPVSG